MCLVKFEGKVVEKFIDVVSKGIGTVYKPRAMRKEADAEAYRQEVLANAQAKSILIEGDAKIELYERVKNRIALQEINRQENIEEIIEKSIPLLKANTTDVEVDNDWRTRFFKKAQDVSNDEMQSIWAKILAEEVSSPGKTSLRTLDVVSNISKKEAERFQVACSFVSNNSTIWKLNRQNALDDYSFVYSDLMLLREAGLINDSDNLNSTISVLPEMKGAIHLIGKSFFMINIRGNTKLEKFTFQQIALTQAGTDICALLDVSINEEYINELLSELEKTYIVSKLSS